MKRWTTVLLLVALSSCTSSQKKSSKRKAEIFYQYGSQQLTEGNYTIALENLIRAHRVTPNKPDVMNNLALAYYHKKQPAVAKQLLKAAVKLSPGHSDALNNLGTIYMEEGQLKQAKQYFQQVSKHLLFKKQFVTYHNLSKIAAREGDIELSRSYNEKSLAEFDRYCPALFHRGLLFYREQKWEQANKSLKEATKGVCYNYSGNHFYRALSLKQLHRLEQAEQILEKLKIDFPKSNYIAKIKMELEDIRKLKNSGQYSQKQKTFNTPSF